jgi:hypothetical protein
MAKKNTTVSKKDKKETIVPKDNVEKVIAVKDIEISKELENKIEQSDEINTDENSIDLTNLDINSETFLEVAKEIVESQTNTDNFTKTVEEVEKPTEKPCNCKKNIVSKKQTFNEMFGYFWNGQTYGE